MEDRIFARRDELVEAFRGKLKPAVTLRTLFTVRRELFGAPQTH